ncbi:flagellar biosynthesis protein FlhB [Seleniivibrio woodruffii]|uniref:Flagellar biosynthetic protein FlhB n=1 Tax=Seleniivibrio woodruffii TaxID=1078050 RepID=A0A4R1KBA8_9BACT|nr:flagellar biosynthesis protein FlhB [Seleniivibrio woodruffii]TCK61724.1 flagellar biosynthetic protein FlhB [Seleniivibrio woodruffii]TVZ35161.1 flagellar biosynthetic protein FlhB [Seleniivibrio woodruffii]
MADENKTEDPTGKRLSDAAAEGNIPKSRELATAIILLGGAIFMHFYGPYFMKGMGRLMREMLTVRDHNITVDNLMAILVFTVKEVGIIVAPLMALLLIISIAANVMQVGFVFTPKALELKWDRINPFTGFGRFFSKKSLVELFKSIFKIFIIGWFAYYIVKGKMETIVTLADADIMDIIEFFGELMYELLWKIGLMTLIMALLDYMYVRYQHKQDLKMTKQEVKDEHKQMEGDPQIKQRIRKAQRDLARQRMMEDVPKADVVVTNPTHYAVALRYNIGQDRAPICLAKGQRLMALRIREVAKENGILIHEDPPVARSLFKTVDIGEEIPENLFKAVAEILALVDKFKNRL